MKTLTRNETAQYLLSHDNYCILSHRRPDGDTIGSSAALCLGLRSLGKKAHVLFNCEVSDRFAWLHAGLTKETEEEGDTIVSVDVASPGMLPKSFEHLLGKIHLRIDHHASATSFTDCELVDGGSASCAELVWDVLAEAGVTMDKQIAEAVYVGTSTDTGCFRYSNTTDHTFATAAACAKAGARVYQLNQELFETNTLGRLRMQAWIVDHMKMLRGGEMAIVAIPMAVEEDWESPRMIWTISPPSPEPWPVSAWQLPSGKPLTGIPRSPSVPCRAMMPRRLPSGLAAAAIRARQEHP